MSVVRMNITIPEDLAHKLNRLIGSRKKSVYRRSLERKD